MDSLSEKPERVEPGLLNTGIAGDVTSTSTSAGIPRNRTLVVTGIARSGTSMIAQVLHAAGVFMGERLLDVVTEDAEIQAALDSGQLDWFGDLVGRRNAVHPVWGFKLPNLHVFLPLDAFARLRHPRLVVILRDPIAVAVRRSLSEHLHAEGAVRETADAIATMVHYAEGTGCPVMYLSYEKTLSFPEMAIDQLLRFCGLPTRNGAAAALCEHVRPNSPDYRNASQKRFDGCIDGIVGGRVQGWVRMRGSLKSLDVEVWADATCLGVYAANIWRDDLAQGGVGNGHHAFDIDLTNFRLRGDAIIRLRVHGRTYEVYGSGRTFAWLRQDASRRVAHSALVLPR